MRKPHVCLIGLSNLPALAEEYGNQRIGGAQVQQTLLARALVRRGYEVSMVVGDYGQPDGATWDGIRTYKAYAPNAGIPVFRFLHPRWTGLIRAIRRADPDICYLSCAGGELGQVVLAEGRRRRIIFWVASDADCDPKRVLIRYWRDRKLYSYGLNRADAILTQSKQQQAALKRNFRADSTVTGSFVELPRDLLGADDRDIDALWVSNIYPLKRPEIVLDLAAQPPHLGFQMIGGPMPGHASFYAEISERAKTLPNLRFCGHVPYQQVHDTFRRARVFINTSDIEGFPNTYLQAWARGTPVVAFFDPDGVIAREGLGMAVRTADEMNAAINGLVKDFSLWRAMSDRCVRYMAREYGEDRIIAPYVAVIDRLGCRAHGN